jgi:hypothetical protein
MKYPKYHKYNNQDPSIPKYASIVTAEILENIRDFIPKRAKRIYHVRPEANIAIDLDHAVIRQLSQRLDKEIIEIDKFEKENSNDLRNYPWIENDEYEHDNDNDNENDNENDNDNDESQQ